jgi:dipeptidyl aminopeptidase/acylaminoacyl peptidase
MSTRSRSIAAGASLALLVGALGAAPALAQDEMAAGEAIVSIPSDGRDIAGVLTLPADADAAVPAVLMLHGYGSTADEVGDMYGRLAEALSAQGVGSLRIDFAGMGASEASTTDYDYGSQTTDASAALDWLLSQEAVDPARVGVQGFSNGSFIGSHLVGTDDRPVAFGSWSGAIYDGDPAAYEASIAECEATGEGHIVLDLGWRTLDHSCDYFASMATATPLMDFASFAAPLLLIAGSDDVVVPPSVSENAATASASEDVTLKILEGADHIYHVLSEDQALAEEAISVTADWFAGKL